MSYNNNFNPNRSPLDGSKSSTYEEFVKWKNSMQGKMKIVWIKNLNLISSPFACAHVQVHPRAKFLSTLCQIHFPQLVSCSFDFLLTNSQIMTNSPATSPVPSKPWFRGVKYSDNFLHQLFCSDRSFLHSAVPPHCRSSVTLDPWSQCNFGPSYWGGSWSC